MKKSTTAAASRTFVRRRLPRRTIGEEFGQHEPLTTRLKRLLDDYTDGFSVLKELVQNADDAGATEIRFLYDERTNEDAMNVNYLFDKGMRDCQGRALWVYNNAAFRDEDFENIEKLSGATKEHDTEKIGKFGLGFNAVYNLTDVPMFLSRNYFVVFDPHMTHLGEFIKKNVARPGIKIDLKKDADGLREYKDQFKPFNGIFGFEFHLNGEVNSFDGTLFRFPLRTKEQAIRSEIKQLFYDDNEMRKLLQMFLQGANNLLIFTQNILRVGIYHLSQFSTQNLRPSLLFEVTKSSSKTGIQRPLSFDVVLPTTAKKLSREEQNFLKQCNFLQVASRFMRHARDHNVDPRQFPKSTLTVDIDCSYTQSGLDYFNVDSWFQQEKAKWLIVSSMGSGQAVQFIKEHDDPSLVASAGVAVQLLEQKSNKFLPSPVIKNVDGQDVNGTVFYYLPLPIHSGLPVHINGAFAVASSRRHLQEKLEDDKSCYRVKWNEVLMQDSVCSAFLILLEDLTALVPVGSSYKFHLLWPTISNVHHNCFPLMKSFYEQVARGDHSLFSDGAHWADVNGIFFLDPEFREKSQIGEASFKIFQMLYGESNVIVDLPCEVFNSFENCSLKNKISARSYSKELFFRECFFENIRLRVLPACLRDVLTLHALDDNSRDFHPLIKQNACIPVSPSGETLKCPSQLVNPSREAASLFSPYDGRFPSGNQESYLNPQRLAKLEQLGMATDDLPWSEVAERAESIQTLNAVDCDAALKRVNALLAFMNTKLERGDRISPTDRRRLMKAKFLPVLNKQDNFPLPWRGYEMQRRTQLQVLLAPEEVFLEEEKYRVCCTQPLVGVFIPRKVKELLELDKKHATLEHVMQQLQQATSVKVEALNAAEYEELSRVCLAAYKYMEQATEKYGAKCKSYLMGKSFILVGRRFLSAQHVAFKLTADCSPFLFKLPQHLANGFPKLMKVAGVKQMFDEKDFISSLQEVKKQFGETSLGEHYLQVAIRLAVQLG